MTAPVAGMPREPRRQALKYWVRERRVAVMGWGAIAFLIIAFLGAWGAGVVNPSPIAEPPTTFGTEGANLVERGQLSAGIEIGAVGDGQDRTFIIRKRGAKGPQPTVIFLHGFGSSIILGYESWLEHLANEGVTVIFPSWQQPPFPIDGSQNPRTNMFDGVKLAVKAVPPIPGQIATAGISAGGALAFDYAALGSQNGVPPARAVYSVYPGRAFPGVKKPILPIPPVTNMEPDTKVEILVSPTDEEVGTRWGKQQYRALAGRPENLRMLRYITTPGLGSHYSPIKTDPKARLVFWKPLDALLVNHLGAKLTPDVPLEESIVAEKRVKKTLKDDSLFRRKAEKLQ